MNTSDSRVNVSVTMVNLQCPLLLLHLCDNTPRGHSNFFSSLSKFFFRDSAQSLFNGLKYDSSSSFRAVLSFFFIKNLNSFLQVYSHLLLERFLKILISPIN